MISFLLANPLVAKLAGIGLVVLAVVLVLIGARRSGEKIGQLKLKLENARVVEQARKKMEAVPRPSDGDVDRRLRDGSF